MVEVVGGGGCGWSRLWAGGHGSRGRFGSKGNCMYYMMSVWSAFSEIADFKVNVLYFASFQCCSAREFVL